MSDKEMESDDELYKCPNCYNRIYKKQIICTKCGFQLRKGVGEPKSIFKVFLLAMIYLGSGIIGLVIILGIIALFLK